MPFRVVNESVECDTGTSSLPQLQDTHECEQTVTIHFQTLVHQHTHCQVCVPFMSLLTFEVQLCASWTQMVNCVLFMLQSSFALLLPEDRWLDPIYAKNSLCQSSYSKLLLLLKLLISFI